MKTYDNLWKPTKNLGPPDFQKNIKLIFLFKIMHCSNWELAHSGLRSTSTPFGQILEVQFRPRVMKTYENLWKHMKTYENLCKTYENLWKYIKTYEIYENPWKSMKTYEIIGPPDFQKNIKLIFPFKIMHFSIENLLILDSGRPGPLLGRFWKCSLV